jgi:hypothetical protein
MQPSSSYSSGNRDMKPYKLQSNSPQWYRWLQTILGFCIAWSIYGAFVAGETFHNKK